ncbi:hypothetical protein [Eubacterium coprostanoligenes]|uniref:hypothetical protein n=1 Tax=Eubacterium coprostanoligenes TaxID=290054 RepID=UPI0023565C05|nr:hypothetical protein [Eubacterium coprostanoligenes]MCI6354767.1 hypothetical protein [Eubacterium coprostanoligenes]
MSSFNMTNEMKNYFDSLPMNIKQELTHSGFSATSLKDLKDIVSQMTEVGDYDGQL